MTELRVVVDTGSPVPAYEQLREQVTTLVTTGALTDGDRLPAARALAADLGLAVGTVQRAYRELELAGTVVSRRRTGTVVTARVSVEEDVRWAAEGFAERALSSGLSTDQALDVVRAALDHVARSRETPRRAPAR
ncbi:GntR family transcriptional regulator [Kineococcus rhizosphaerae]|uniref:GntR family transcriptional regulator n=1 Tax=Kineococcus rhizosphaerae TaxID=559628 RepID=A0A2T0R589_9ACTN|nr:GntR family transcriptional regulator [Kineococcus rhizosphaerae]PRY15904.1 GntR family transcriptional regulator [Kineococcus rhizosphaerae]